MSKPHRPLSGREAQLIDLASAGFTDKEIARELGISDGTVATYWERIRAKLGPHHRSELVALCMNESAERRVRKLAAEIRELRSKLRTSEAGHEHDRHLGDFAPTPLLIVRCDGNVDDLNPAAEALLGYPKSELVGNPFTRVVPPYLAGAYRRALRELCCHDGTLADPTHRFLRLVDAKGKRLAVRIAVVRQDLPEGCCLACSMELALENAR